METLRIMAVLITKRRRMKNDSGGFSLRDIKPKDLLPLSVGFPPTASRELAFAVPKFLVFDALAKTITGFIHSQAGPGALPIQVGVGTTGLVISAISSAVAGLAGTLISHPADLILTYTSASKKKGDAGADWKEVAKDLLSREGGIANLFVGLSLTASCLLFPGDWTAVLSLRLCERSLGGRIG
jgi:hypothetical protein